MFRFPSLWLCLLMSVAPMWAAPVARARETPAHARAVEHLRERAQERLNDPKMRANAVIPSRLERLDAQDALHLHPKDFNESRARVRQMKSPFNRSLALGGFAVLNQNRPDRSEEFYREAVSESLKITGYTESDPSSFRYLLQIAADYDAPRARRLLHEAPILLRAWDERGQLSAASMSELARATVRVFPEGVDALKRDHVARSHHFWEAAEILARFEVERNPHTALEQVRVALGSRQHFGRIDTLSRAVFDFYARRDLPMVLRLMHQIPDADDRASAYWRLGDELLDGRLIDEAARVLNEMETLARDQPGASDEVKRLRERIQAFRTLAGRDLATIYAATPDVIDAFLRPREAGTARGFNDYQDPLISRQLVFRDRAQAEAFLEKALPHARQIQDIHGSPRSDALGRLALVAAHLGRPEQAASIIDDIPYADLQVFFGFEAYQVFRPLPPVLNTWPIFYWERVAVSISE